MAWTDPAGHVFVVGEVVTAATLNTYVKDNLLFLRTRNGLRLRRVANQLIASGGAGTAITFDTEDEDFYNMVGASPSLVTIPSGGGGLWSIYAELTWATATTNHQGYLSTGSGGGFPLSYATATYGQRTASAVLYIPDAGTVTLTAFQSSGSATNATARLDMFRLAS